MTHILKMSIIKCTSNMEHFGDDDKKLIHHSIEKNTRIYRDIEVPKETIIRPVVRYEEI